VLIGESAELDEELVAEVVVAAFALDRLDDDCGDIVAVPSEDFFLFRSPACRRE